eukprot:gnl/TRDRNA2_/TRDRNA2_157998_c1_seq1.p1 gnl/TRDRNA2_/TRDRNA2_157998_c1~~gnl/TRDRNA2_/TRDRNA2_157998_c1_seq1.p1  ORF type:complete len:173 (+),score=19.94 gnl/TRDRNA2_/TRDRNA2_157998_c1_seq1:58-576(+)
MSLATMRFSIFLPLLILGKVRLGQAACRLGEGEECRDCFDDGLCADGPDDVAFLRVLTSKPPADVKMAKNNTNLSSHYDDRHQNMTQMNEKDGGQDKKVAKKDDPPGCVPGSQGGCNQCWGCRGWCYEECERNRVMFTGESTAFLPRHCPVEDGCHCPGQADYDGPCQENDR